jgi:hypothetical protein
MKKLILILSVVMLAACASKPKTETVDTNLDKKSDISSNEAVGMKKDQEELVYQKKSNILNDLTRLEEEVYQLQDDVYGTREYNSKGLFGQFLACRKKRAIKTGELSRIPDKSPVIEEDKVKLAIDQQTGKPIGYTEEGLEKRLARFKEYKNVLYDRKEEVESLIEKCEVESNKKNE